jgi:serine/threonine protein kinase
MKGTDVALAVISKGLVPTLPNNTPSALAQIIQRCFAYDATQRPSMESLHSQLSIVQL